MGVTKAALGSHDIADAWLQAGVPSLGDARIENLERLQAEDVLAPRTLIRSPMLSQVDRVVRGSDISLNTEPKVLAALSAAAGSARLTHGVVLMVELGDLREGIMPDDLERIVGDMLHLPNLVLHGIGANMACRSGAVPGIASMGLLSGLVDGIEATYGVALRTVSGGNSANLSWALSGADVGRVNELRLGESLLLGRDPLDHSAIEGLYTDAIKLVAEVIEAQYKPAQPWGEIGAAAFAHGIGSARGGRIRQAILAIGEQDVDPLGLSAPPGLEIIGASSDHLVVDASDGSLAVGHEVHFELNYSALVRAMTSPFVSKVMQPSLALVAT